MRFSLDTSVHRENEEAENDNNYNIDLEAIDRIEMEEKQQQQQQQQLSPFPRRLFRGGYGRKDYLDDDSLQSNASWISRRSFRNERRRLRRSSSSSWASTPGTERPSCRELVTCRLGSRRSTTLTVTWLIVASGCVAAIAFWTIGILSALSDSQRRFETDVEEMAIRIHSAFREYETAALWIHQQSSSHKKNIAIDTISITEDPLDKDFDLYPPNFRSIFRDLYEAVISHGLPLHAIQYIPNVTYYERDWYENEARQFLETNYPSFASNYSGFVGFIPDATSAGGTRLGPRFTQPFYFPVHFVEPISDNLGVVDFDIYSEAYPRAAVNTALQTRLPVITGRIRLIQEYDPHPDAFSVLMMHPGLESTELYETNYNDIDDHTDNSLSNTTTSSSTAGSDLSLIAIRIPSLLEYIAYQSHVFAHFTGSMPAIQLYLYDCTPEDAALDEEPLYLGGAEMWHSHDDNDDDILHVAHDHAHGGIGYHLYHYDSDESQDDDNFDDRFYIDRGEQVVDGVHLRYLPSESLDSLKSENSRLYTTKLEIGTRQWKLAAIPSDGTYAPSLTFAIVGGVLILVSFLCLGLWVYTSMNRATHLSKLRTRAHEEKALLKIDHARQAAAAERQLNEFIAHEVRNPLAAAMSACSFVSSQMNDLFVHLPNNQQTESSRMKTSNSTSTFRTASSSNSSMVSDIHATQKSAPVPLFSLHALPTTSTEGKMKDVGPSGAESSEKVTKPAPLFSLDAPHSTTAEPVPEQKATPAPLFSLNVTTATSKETSSATNHDPSSENMTISATLFSINATTQHQSPTSEGISDDSKTARSPSQTQQIESSSTADSQLLPKPLFALNRTAPEAPTKFESAPENKSKQPVLFSHPSVSVKNTMGMKRMDSTLPAHKVLSAHANIFSEKHEEGEAKSAVNSSESSLAETNLSAVAASSFSLKSAATAPLPLPTSQADDKASAAKNSTSYAPESERKTEMPREIVVLKQEKQQLELKLQQLQQQQLQQEPSTAEFMKQRETVMEDLHIIDSSLQFINELLRNMLDVQRAACHQLKVELGPTDILSDILEPVDAMLYRRGLKNVEVILDCPFPDGMLVETDRLRLKQVVLNLGRNAAKFVEKGFIRFKVVVVPNTHIQQEHFGNNHEQVVQIWIEDTGPGIPEDKKDKLFAKFQESLDSLSQGTGLGLSLCKILVRLMGGDVWLDETYDSGYEGQPGSRFIIDLQAPPIMESENQVADHMNGHTGISSLDNGTTIQRKPSLGRGKPNDASLEDQLPASLSVLMVDDDTVLRKLLVRAVRGIAPGWKIQEAASGEAALRLVADKTNHFDLVFMDQYMASAQKQLLGTETVYELRSKGVSAKIVGLSANEMATDFFAAGADAFVCKPLPTKRDDLIPILCEVLNGVDSMEGAPATSCRRGSTAVIHNVRRQ